VGERGRRRDRLTVPELKAVLEADGAVPARGAARAPARVDPEGFGVGQILDEGDAFLLAEDQQRLAERLGEGAARGYDRGLRRAHEGLAAARIDHVAVGAPRDLDRLAEAPRDGERAVAQVHHAREAALGVAQQHAPATPARGRSQGEEAAPPEAREGVRHALRRQDLRHAVERPALRDAAQVHGHPGAREPGARWVCGDLDPVRSHARPRPRDLPRARGVAAPRGLPPERDERSHRHVEAAAREARVATRVGEDLRQGAVHLQEPATGRAVQAGKLALRIEAREETLELGDPCEAALEHGARGRLVARRELDLEDRPHGGSPVGDEDRSGRRGAGGEEGDRDEGADHSSGPSTSASPSSPS
jgi:hypothetical protein